MKMQIIQKVLNSMYEECNEEQLAHLKQVLFVILSDYKIQKKKNEVIHVKDKWQKDLSDFLMQKKLEGKSIKTLKQYKYQLYKLLSYINKDTEKISDGDIYKYLMYYQTKNNISNRSLDNMRLCFSTFFSWAAIMKRIDENPMLTIQKIKCDSKIKEPFTDEERELLRCSCTNKRDIAIIEFLYSTGVRVSELVALNINDVKFKEKEAIVFGKGAKERIVYLNAKAYLYLSQYLQNRTDKNPALFVSNKSPHNRLTVSGVETMLKALGKRAGVSNVHPHRFRRTTATNALNRGMELQYVCDLLGHTSTNTTMIYCSVKRQNVKISHEKFLVA